MSGTLIVLDGTDGAGKSTQFSALTKRLTEQGRAFRTADFPRYGEPSAEMARLYLQGYFGDDPDAVNAYAASSFYGIDRYTSWMKDDWGAHYRAGGLVLTDRYTTANAVHQMPKLPTAQQAEFAAWLFDFEYQKLAIPKPDLVLFLDMPVELSAQMMRGRERETHTRRDIHERDEAYLQRCRNTALELAAAQGWRIISCARDGTVRSIAEIHEEIFTHVQTMLEAGV